MSRRNPFWSQVRSGVPVTVPVTVTVPVVVIPSGVRSGQAEVRIEFIRSEDLKS